MWTLYLAQQQGTVGNRATPGSWEIAKGSLCGFLLHMPKPVETPGTNSEAIQSKECPSARTTDTKTAITEMPDIYSLEARSFQNGEDRP